ncbi:MAG TPA: SDR family oxidoreductase [Bacteroidetes bacterium]|nr:SDR family oxidoreductase [Bacteroidota bacterium]
MNQIFISGASKGIGLATAEKFYQEGWKVIICARGQAALDAAQAKMPKLITYTCDLADKNAVKELAAKIQLEHGTLDILFNNGGTFLPGQLHSEEDEVFENLMATNLFSAYYMTKGLLPNMIALGKGTVVNMCSIASINAYAQGGAYSVSKFGLYGFSKSLREEMKPKGIRVISILPGATFTASWEGMDLPEARFIPAEDIAELVWTACKLSDRTVVEDIVVRPQLGDI